MANRFYFLCVLVFSMAVSYVRADDVNGGGALGWPEFRGPNGNGIATEPGVIVGLPTEWDEARNITWKTAIPHKGWSSPVVLEGKVWLTTATEDGHDYFVVCVDAETGKFLLNEKLFHSDNPEPLGNDVNCYASPTPVVEPGRVYVNFGSYGTACLDTKTYEKLWERTDLQCRHYRGPGSSPILYENLLILTFDGVDVQYVIALDKATGETVWKTARTTEWTDLDENGQPLREGDFRKSFTTPLVISVGERVLLISPATFAAFAYDVKTGEEVWKTKYTAYSPALRPVYGDGLLYIATGRGNTGEVWAMRPDGSGDVTESKVVWKAQGGIVPFEPSPLLIDSFLYLVNNNGILTCLDAATGEKVWDKRVGGNCIASPIYGDGNIYVSNTQGRTMILKAGNSPDVVATNNLDDGCMASPAVCGKALFLRTKTHLYRIENQ